MTYPLKDSLPQLPVSAPGTGVEGKGITKKADVEAFLRINIPAALPALKRPDSTLESTQKYPIVHPIWPPEDVESMIGPDIED